METPPLDTPQQNGHNGQQNGRYARVTTGGVSLHGWALASVLAGLMLTLLLSALDQTIVSTAMPKIAADLRASYDLYTWPAIAYLLASTTMIPIVGKLSDLFGRKWFLMTGVVIFLVGSALSGASQTMYQLIGFRSLQGLGGGMLMALVFTLVGDIFVPAERARWQGLFTGVFALASVIGPAAGGYITDNYTWRWIFYVNLPIGILALAALFIWLPANISARSMRHTGWAAVRRIDFAGSLTASAATICLLLGLTWGGGQTYAWSSPQVAGTLGASAVLFVAFVAIERFALEPILPLALFKNRVFAAGALLALLIGMALLAMAFYLPLFIQGVLGQSATSSGAAITPLTLTMAIGAALVGQIISRVGRYQFAAVLGGLVMTGGAFLLTQLTASSSVLDVTRDMIVIGLGMGMLQPVMTLAVQNAIPRTQLGVGTGAVTYLRSVGSTFGLAALGAVETSAFSDQLARRMPAAARPFTSRLQPSLLQQALAGGPAVRQRITSTAVQQAVHQQVPRIVAQMAPPAAQQAINQAVNTAVQQAVAQATAHVPPGPHHAQIVAQITQQVTATVAPQVRAQVTPLITQQVTARVTASVTGQVTHQATQLVQQVLEAARLSMAVAIQHAFVVSVAVSVGIVLVAFFLKDLPLVSRFQPAATAEASARLASDATAATGAGELGPSEVASPGV